MPWGDLTDDFAGLDTWGPQTGAGDLPPSEGSSYVPEVEKHRAWAMGHYGNPDDVDKYLRQLQIQYNTDNAPKARSALATSLADQGDAPEVQAYTGQENALSRLRQSRAEAGQTSAPTSDFEHLAELAYGAPLATSLLETHATIGAIGKLIIEASFR